MEGVVAGHALARRVRRHPRRRLERRGGSGERRPVRPRALRRHASQAARQPLQPDRGRALGHAARPTSPAPSTPADLDGDGTSEFGEVLPDARFLLAAARGVRHATRRSSPRPPRPWEPSESDAFTALVVMVPTMSEYFGQWKESRFVLGEASESESFNVVSRLSDISDILSGLEVDLRRRRARLARGRRGAGGADRQGARRPRARSSTTSTPASSRASASRPSRPTCSGREAQDRATAIAGQVSQAAAELGVTIEQ